MRTLLLSVKWVKVAQSCPALCDSMDCIVHGILQARLLEWVNCSLLQGIFPGFPDCRWILYQLSHQESPKIPEWVAYPFSNGSSQPRNQTGVSCIAGRFFTNWATYVCYKGIYRQRRYLEFSSVQSLSRVRLFATPWITAHQASLSITISPKDTKKTDNCIWSREKKFIGWQMRRKGDFLFILYLLYHVKCVHI